MSSCRLKGFHVRCHLRPQSVSRAALVKNILLGIPCYLALIARYDKEDGTKITVNCTQKHTFRLLHYIYLTAFVLHFA